MVFDDESMNSFFSFFFLFLMAGLLACLPEWRSVKKGGEEGRAELGLLLCHTTTTVLAAFFLFYSFQPPPPFFFSLSFFFFSIPLFHYYYRNTFGLDVPF